MIDFDSWRQDNGFAEGSGRSEKIWLVSPDNATIGLFKFPKSAETTEHISERLASDIGEALEIKCAKIDIGERGGRIGSISYLINTETETLIEGGDYITAIRPQYDADALIDRASNEYYSFDFILDATRNFVSIGQWIEMLLFDFLIGNSDRHQGNWALIGSLQGREWRRSPLYDNGSSLCAFVPEQDIPRYFGRDPGPMRALVDSKSRSAIRIHKSERSRPRHREVVQYLLRTYPRTTTPIAEKIVTRMNPDRIAQLLEQFGGCLLSDGKRRLIESFLIEKVRLLEICLMEGRL